MDHNGMIAESKIEVSLETLHTTSPEIDAVVNVSVSEDRLEARISIDPPENGREATYESLVAALSERGVTYNINHERLKELAENPVYHESFVVAAGVAPADGEDGTATFRIQIEKKPLRPKEYEDGTVDYRELDIVENVSEGQVLCEITMPTEGTPGLSVEGKELRQKRGRAVPNHLGQNTGLNEDGTAIVSKITGQVEFVGGKIRVNETFFVKENVDNSTGNIKVEGNVVVKGMISSGFEIQAGRNVDVYGIVENASIKSGGGVQLKSGITGSKLYCEGDLKCRFIENCLVFVKGDVHAEYIINSNVKCGKNIEVSGKMAKIIGGSCIAGKNIIAKTIGSAANVETKLELGTDSTVIERQQALIKEAADLEKQITKLNPLINILRQLEECNRLTEDKKETYDKAIFSYNTFESRLQEARKELEEIAESIRTRGYGRVIGTGVIYPGTKVIIGSENYSVSSNLNNTSIYFNANSHAICTGKAR